MGLTVFIFRGLGSLHFGRLDRFWNFLLGQLNRIDKVDHQFGQALPAVLVVGVLDQQCGIRSGEPGERMVYLQQAVLDTLGDGNFAFTGQQLNRTHLAHIHAHRVGSAADLGFHSGQRCRCLFGRGVVLGGRGGGVVQDQRIGIRCDFVHRNTHIVDHVDDVFDLFRIDDVIRQMIVHLGICEEALLFTLGNELF